MYHGYDCGCKYRQAPSTIGNAFYGNNNGTTKNNANNHNDNGSFRAALRVYELCTDFNHPPSILPISSNLDWSWKILVSLIKASSSNNRSFRFETSNLLLAFIKYPAFNVFGAFFAITKLSMQSKTEFSRLKPIEYFLLFSSLLFRSIIALYAS